MKYASRCFKSLFIVFAVCGAFLQPVQAANQADLWFYITNDKYEDIQELLRAGLNPNSINNKQQPALMQAIRDGAWKSFDIILANPKTDVNLGNQFGETPLMYVALLGDTARAQKLIARGAKVNKDGWTPLHYAATGGHLDIMRLLLEEHAFIDAQSPNGTTPLMMAASYGTPEAVKLLIEAGADIHMRNQKGLSALDFARRAERRDSVELMETALRWSQQKQGPRGQW